MGGIENKKEHRRILVILCTVKSVQDLNIFGQSILPNNSIAHFVLRNTCT